MSNSVRPHRRQPTRLPCPCDSPGKNTGVGWHFLLQCMKVKSEREVAQSCPTLSDPMDCSLPGSSIHGIFQAGVLEWGAEQNIWQLKFCVAPEQLRAWVRWLCVNMRKVLFRNLMACFNSWSSFDQVCALRFFFASLDFHHLIFLISHSVRLNHWYSNCTPWGSLKGLVDGVQHSPPASTGIRLYLSLTFSKTSLSKQRILQVKKVYNPLAKTISLII